MKTPIYIKVQTSEQLLLGEGACRQLQIINYHPDVSDRKGRKWNRHNQIVSDSGRQGSSQGGVDAPAPIVVEEKTETDTKARKREHCQEALIQTKVTIQATTSENEADHP